jgi:hypothetical protein
MSRVIRAGAMHPSQYLIMLSQARLTQAEKDALINGLNATASGQ